MKKLFINGIICSALVLGVLCGNSVEAKAASIDNTKSEIQEVSLEKEITEQSKEDRLASEEKMKLAEKYVKNKSKSNNKTDSSKNILKSASSSKTLSSYATEKQERGTWCGPASAYNATNGAHTQMYYASELLTNSAGFTPFPGTWRSVMGTDFPGNNYQTIRAASYESVDWANKLRNSIIYTIDKGYPVIADCIITSSDDNTHIHPNYGYKEETRHYVAVVGYNDRVSPMKVRIVDSNTKSDIPIEYWTTVDKLAAATNPVGIVW